MSEVRLTRGQLLAGGTVGVAAAVARPRQAQAQRVAGDAAILSLAVTLEAVQRTFYRQALDRVPDLDGDARRIAAAIAEEEDAHLGGAIDLLETIGGDPNPPPRLDERSAGIPSPESMSFGDAFSSERRFLREAQRLENLVVRAYNGAGPLISQRSVFLATAAVAQVEARHAAAVAVLRGEAPAESAFDRGLSPDAVRRVVARRYLS